MSIQFISTDKVQANPYQPRLHDDPEHVARLAEDIRERGLLQTPLGRSVNGHVQLAFGHSRLAAWKIAKPGESFPVEIRELTDRDLSDMAAAENAQRKNLTAIETAQAILRRMKDFKLTQMEAAKPFGYASQGSISNLLRLLKLPAPKRTDGQKPGPKPRRAKKSSPIVEAFRKHKQASMAKVECEQCGQAIAAKYMALHLRKKHPDLAPDAV